MRRFLLLEEEESGGATASVGALPVYLSPREQRTAHLIPPPQQQCRREEYGAQTRVTVRLSAPLLGGHERRGQEISSIEAKAGRDEAIEALGLIASLPSLEGGEGRDNETMEGVALCPVVTPWEEGIGM